jgi:drug/metabolite transporter (DMT)-like permease
MWIGFFAWYRGLALGGTLRVSQVQLIQPFASMLVAVPLLGERLDLLTVGFALAVIATVLVGKRLPVGTAPTGRPPSPHPLPARSPA